MSNLPPGVSDSTYGSPWNEYEINGYIDLRIFVTTSMAGPVARSEWLELATEQVKGLLEHDIKKKLNSIDGVNDMEIIDIQID